VDPGRNPHAAGIVALALTFHRAPTQHAALLHGQAPLPPGLGALLKLAGGSEPDPESAALAPPDELKAAALFFIEQVLLHHDGSHYRVLGLGPAATTAQIKEHHRLLMRVFHPDRERHDDDWKDAFATRINLAYTSLHDAESRRRYDASLSAARPGMAPPSARRAALRTNPPRSFASRLPPVLLRFLPQWVLASTALLALVAVGAVYVSNSPARRLHAVETARFAAPLREAPATSTPAMEMVIVAAEKPDLPPEPEARTQAPASIPPPVPLAAPRKPAPLAAPLQPPSGNQVTTTTAARLEPAPAPAPLREAPAARIAQPEPRAELAARPVQPDPNATLAQFVASYERGDTPAFMALFDEVAIGRAGGKPQIRREHESLFQSTDLRHIAIDGMAWAQEGDWMRGEGRYRTTLMRKGEQRLQTETGVIRIELQRRDGHALIMVLDYGPGGRS
jgi:hypothetical protein